MGEMRGEGGEDGGRKGDVCKRTRLQPYIFEDAGNTYVTYNTCLFALAVN